MADSNVVILVLFWCLYWLILSPTLCYYTIQFYQLRYTQIVRKRFYNLTIFLAISSIFTITVYSPFYLLRIYYISLNQSFIVMDIIYVTMYSFCIYSIATLLSLRFWCLWYFVKWTKATLDAEWKIHISKELSENWFISHQHTYGTIHYVSRIAALYLIIAMALFCLPRYITVIDADNGLAAIFAAIFNLLILIIPIIGATITWFKTPIFNDSFDLVREHRLMARIATVLAIAYISIYLAPILGATQYTRWMLGNVMSVLFSFTASMFPICYAIQAANSEDYLITSPSSMINRLKAIPSRSINGKFNRVNSPSNHSSKFSFDSRRGTNTNITDKGDMHKATASSSTTTESLMMNVLGHDLAFSGFMNHLSNEFSMELLLCFVELSQYKEEILIKLQQTQMDEDNDKDNNDKEKENENEIGYQQETILQNTFIPKSFIVYQEIENVLENYHQNGRRSSFSYSDGIDSNDDHENDEEYVKLLKEYQLRGYILYCKYIDSASEFQINVSDEESKRLFHKLNYKNRLNQNDLFTLYDKTLQELWHLLRHSFYRFLKTNEYKELLQYISSS